MTPRPFLSLLLLSLLWAVLPGGSAEASPPGGVVVLPGARLPALSGAEVGRIAAYAAKADGAAVAIPFQVDERDPRGRYVVDRPVDGAPSDLPRDDGRFDANDEAVFDAGDAGSRLEPDSWPAHRRGMEIEIADAAGGKKRFVYLLEVPASPEPPRRDVRYVAEGNGRVEARNYGIAFGKRPTTIESLEITEAAGGNGISLLKRSHHKVYSRLSPYLLSLRINRDDDDVVAQVLGYREGPVRVVRLVRRHTDLVLGLATPQHVRTEFYSASQAEWREEVGYSLDMDRLVARSVVETWFEFSDEVEGASFRCEGCGDAAGSGVERRRPGGAGSARSVGWWGVHGPAGAIYARYWLGGEGEQALLFEEGKGGKGGWQVDVLSMEGRIHPFRTQLVFPDRGIAADPTRIPWIGAPEPRITVRGAEPSGGARRFSASGPATPRGIERRYDVVVLTGYGLGPFLGLPVEKLRLLAARGGKLLPVPFQVDERDGEGRYVLPEGEAPTADVDGGRLDDNDEIVTMIDRVGDRVTRKAWPAGAARGAEISVRDPVTGESGWLYLFAFDDPPPLAEEDLVRLDGPNKVRTEVFTVGFPADKIFFDQFTMKTAGQPDFSDNLVDRLKIRFRLTFKFLFIPLPYRAGEDDFGRKTVAYRDGPIRLLLRQDLLAKLTFGVTFHMEPSDWVFYVNQAVSEVIVKNPFLYNEGALDRVSNAHFLQTVDLDRSARGMRFYNSENQGGVVVDGEMSEAEKNLDRGKDEWIVVTGKQAHSIARIVFLDEIDPDRALHYLDDKNEKDWNDRDYGQWGNAGYDVDLKAEGSVMLLTSPQYTIMLYFYLPPDFSMEDRREILDILDRPVEVGFSPPAGSGEPSLQAAAPAADRG